MKDRKTARDKQSEGREIVIEEEMEGRWSQKDIHGPTKREKETETKPQKSVYARETWK